MNIKRSLTLFNRIILCLLAIHLCLEILFGSVVESLLFSWGWYGMLYVIGFVCEQVYTAVTEREAKAVRGIRIVSAMFSVCAVAHILLDADVLTWYSIPLVSIWALWLWVEAREMAPEKKTRNTANRVLTSVYVIHAVVDILMSYADGDGIWYPNPVALIPDHAATLLLFYLPVFILINMAITAVQAYQKLPDD